MDAKRAMLRHFLAALAYRTQKAVRGAPASFASFTAGNRVRTPHELVLHLTSLLGYARTLFLGGTWRPTALPTFEAEIARFHDTLTDLATLLENDTPLSVSPEQLLQGPFADAMTHVGQLAMLRRLSGTPIPPENFVFADISSDNLGPHQPPPARPDVAWPEGPDGDRA
ncbi:MAG TPA: hypothetical protein VF178_17005 [Gemmatimonadaceae bacterium]